MGDIPLAIKDWDQVEQNPFFCPDPDKIDALDELMRGLKKEGDSIGAKVTVVADGVPPGLGEPVFDRLDADIAHALMSINAVKGVEIGDGFEVVKLRGSENRDEITKAGFQEQPRRRHSWRHQQRPADRCQHRAEAYLQYYRSRSYD